MKKIILILVIILFAISGCGGSTISIAEAYSVPHNETKSYTYEDMDLLTQLITDQVKIMEAAHQMADAARALGYEENHDVIKLAQEEWKIANTLKIEYESIYDTLKKQWELKEQEYPEATFIWIYLKNLGYSEEVRAGIMGNIMTECGGNTLALQPTIYGKGYYGICQWSKKYSSEVWGASLEVQCDYLRDTIKEEIDIFGKVYKKDFNYNDFIALTNIEDAALAFAKSYERSGSSGYQTRQDNATVAYNYFVS